MTDDELEGLKGIHDPEEIDELRELADAAETESDAEAGEDEVHGDRPAEHPDPSDPGHAHGVHELPGHDAHDAHDAHPPESSSWVLIPLAVGVIIAIVLLAIFGLASKAAEYI